MGSKRVRRVELPHAFDQDDYHQTKNATVSIISHPKHLYGSYFSSVFHTHKLHIPKKVFFIAGLLGVTICILVYAFFNFSSRGNAINQPSAEKAEVTSTAISYSTNPQPGSTIVKFLPDLRAAYFPTCLDLTFTGYDFVGGTIDFFLNCHLDTTETYTIAKGGEGQEYEFSYDHSKTLLLDSFFMKHKGFDYKLVGNRLFLSAGNTLYFIARI